MQKSDTHGLRQIRKRKYKVLFSLVQDLFVLISRFAAKGKSIIDAIGTSREYTS